MKIISLIFLSSALLLLCLPSYGFYKTDAGIEGHVRDQGKAIPGISVSLLSAVDSSVVKMTVTDNNGRFEIEFHKFGRYLLLLQGTHYHDQYSPVFTLSSDRPLISLNNIILQPVSPDMNSVTVTSRKPLIEQRIDRMVINVGASITAVGNTVWELLQKSPGIAVDDNNNTIRLRGKTGVLVYIDDKPTYMSEEQLANMLRNMDASSIQSIEIMTHPPARYDAAGNAGIINIITKKNRIVGVNGSITSGFTQGTYGRQYLNGNINYRKNKFNFYGSGGLNHRKRWHDFNLDRRFSDSNNTLQLLSRQISKDIQRSIYFEYKAGLDYYFSEKSTLGFVFSGAGNPSKTNSENTTRFLDPENRMQSFSNTYSFNKRNWSNNNYGLNYKKDMDTLGRFFSADVSYTKFNSHNDQDFHTDYFNADSSLSTGMDNPGLRKGKLPSGISILVGKLDYGYPLGNKAKLDAGLKISNVVSDNDVNYHIFHDNAWISDTTATNRFKYRENINAAYLNFSKEFKKGWSVQLGLRGEQTVSNGHQYSNDSIVKRNYFQLFPTLFVQRKIGDNNSFGFSYSRRIDRPDYDRLNPFRYYIDPYTYGVGNPFLQPQITNSFELSYAYKSLLIASFNYSKTSRAMSEILVQSNADTILYQTYANLNTAKSLNLNLSSTVEISPWFTTNNNLTVYRNFTHGVYLEEKVSRQKTAFNFNTTNSFKLPRNYSIELTGFYNSPGIYSFFNFIRQYQVSLGIQKTFWDKKATVKLNVNDLFKTLNGGGYMRIANINADFINHWQNRTVGLNFTYRFSKGTTNSREHESSSSEEQNRIKK